MLRHVHLKTLVDGIDGLSFYMIDIDDNGKIIKSMENMIINKKIIKKLRKADAENE